MNEIMKGKKKSWGFYNLTGEGTLRFTTQEVATWGEIVDGDIVYDRMHIILHWKTHCGPSYVVLLTTPSWDASIVVRKNKDM